MATFRKMLNQNEMLNSLSLSSVNLGNLGMSVICKALNFELDSAIQIEKDKENKKHGEFIKSGTQDHKNKDFSVLPELKETHD